MTPSVLLEHLDNGVSRIVINRPPLNLLNDDALAGLRDAFVEVEDREQTRAVILTGTGDRAFSGGHELTRAEADNGMRSEEEARQDPGGLGRRVTEQIEYLSKPVVCVARGWVVGGSISFFLASDVRLAAESVKFRYVDVKMGMAPAWGLTLARMVHYLGRNRTLDFLLSPDDVDAARAMELGLVTRVVSHADLDSEALRNAEHLALGAPLTVRALKECTRIQYTASFEEAKRKQDEWIVKIARSHDSKEGTRAWLDKRSPRFQGA